MHETTSQETHRATTLPPWVWTALAVLLALVAIGAVAATPAEGLTAVGLRATAAGASTAGTACVWLAAVRDRGGGEHA